MIFSHFVNHWKTKVSISNGGDIVFHIPFCQTKAVVDMKEFTFLIVD